VISVLHTANWRLLICIKAHWLDGRSLVRCPILGRSLHLQKPKNAKRNASRESPAKYRWTTDLQSSRRAFSSAKVGSRGLF